MMCSTDQPVDLQGTADVIIRGAKEKYFLWCNTDVNLETWSPVAEFY